MSEPATTIIMPVEHRRPVPAVNDPETATILSVIERAARDPNVDVDKMERLMAMAERMSDRTARAAFAAALAEMQPNLPVIAERGAIRHKVGGPAVSTYALWEDINDAIKPILAEHGFALSFRVGSGEGKISVTGVLSHRDGHSEETTMVLPVDASGSKNAVQAVGSSTSYGKRYTAQALLNLTSRGEDDDGKAAGSGERINDDQLAEIQALMEDVGADRDKFLQYLKVESLSLIPQNRYDAAIKALEAKRRAQ